MELVDAKGGGVALFDICDTGMTMFAVLKPARFLGNLLIENLTETSVLGVGTDDCRLQANGAIVRAGGVDASRFRIVAAAVSDVFRSEQCEALFCVDGTLRASRKGAGSSAAETRSGDQTARSTASPPAPPPLFSHEAHREAGHSRQSSPITSRDGVACQVLRGIEPGSNDLEQPLPFCSPAHCVSGGPGAPQYLGTT